MTTVNALAATTGTTYRAAGTTSTSGTSNTSSGSSTSSTTNDQMGKDTFLKLLVAQLQYQDPSNPADATQFISQTAQFTVVEKLSDLATQNDKLLSMGLAQSAASLVGRTVTWTDADNTSHSGVVTAANLTSPPTLTVGDLTVDLSAVTAVKATAGSTG
jgi:flagellar basal-body rod modification protein FlgD